MARKRVKLKKKAKGLLVLILMILVGIGVYGVVNYKQSIKKPEPKKKVVKKEEPKVPKEYTAKVFMVGDALIHSAVYEDARKDDGSYDFKPMIADIKKISSQYDIAYYNQETILGGKELGLSNYPMFNSPQEVGDAFVDAGFNTVSLATNHTMDKGEAGVLASVAYWKKQKDVAWSGQWSSEEERTNSVQTVYEVNGIK